MQEELKIMNSKYESAMFCLVFEKFPFVRKLFDKFKGIETEALKLNKEAMLQCFGMGIVT